MGSLIVLIAIIVVLYFLFKKDDDKTSTAKIDKEKNVTLKTKNITDDNEEAYSMYFDVVGESFDNDDGSSRQEIIEKYVKELGPTHLKFYTYKGDLACAVYVDEALTKQVGNIAKDEVEELYEILIDDSHSVNPRFYEKKGGGDYKYGVTIELLIVDN